MILRVEKHLQKNEKLKILEENLYSHFSNKSGSKSNKSNSSFSQCNQMKSFFM